MTGWLRVNNKLPGLLFWFRYKNIVIKNLLLTDLLAPQSTYGHLTVKERRKNQLKMNKRY